MQGYEANVYLGSAINHQMIENTAYIINNRAMMFNSHSKYLDTLISKPFNALGIDRTPKPHNAVLILFSV